MMKENMNQLLTLKETAAYLRRSERWVRQAISYNPDEVGSIPYLRLPGHRGGILFDVEELNSWLKSGSPPVKTWKSWKKKERPS